MMKRVIILVCLCVGTYWSYAQKKTPGSSNYKITLSINKEEYDFGEPIEVTVKYFNGSNNVWQLYKPDSSFYNSISYMNVLWRTQTWNGYAFNESRFINDDPDCPECGFAVALTGGIIRLEPKHIYSFKTEIMSGQKDHFFILPGTYLIRYHDSYEAIQSDTVVICLVFNENSVGYLLKWLVDEEKIYTNIEWAIMLLSNIYPEMKNYQFTSKDNSITYTSEQSENNNKLLNDFKLYWNQNKGSSEIKEKIHRINTDLRKYSFIDMRRTKLSGKKCIDYN